MKPTYRTLARLRRTSGGSLHSSMNKVKSRPSRPLPICFFLCLVMSRDSLRSNVDLSYCNNFLSLRGQTAGLSTLLRDGNRLQVTRPPCRGLSQFNRLRCAISTHPPLLAFFRNSTPPSPPLRSPLRPHRRSTYPPVEPRPTALHRYILPIVSNCTRDISLI